MQFKYVKELGDGVLAGLMLNRRKTVKTLEIGVPPSKPKFQGDTVRFLDYGFTL